MGVLAALLIASALGGILYRMGGASGFNTKFRDLGIPIVGIALLFFYGNYSHLSLSVILSLIASFALMFAAQTTYFKKKGADAKWWNWALVGLANGLALIPWAFATGHWILFGLRTLILVPSITLWSSRIGNAVLEEIGRGILIILTLGLFLKW